MEEFRLLFRCPVCHEEVQLKAGTIVYDGKYYHQICWERRNDACVQ